MQRQQQNLAAIYLRLSKDDGGDSESNSIQNQRMLLSKYAKEQGFFVFSEYIDDGISGTTFERDSFKRMISDIEDGKIGIVICKDLSRLGRNNAMVAFYTEIVFPERDVRFIALNDGIDSAKGDNEIMGFKSIINEFYARDLSKKIKSVKQAQAQQGKFVSGTPAYGYMIDPLDKYHLVINPDTAPIVKRIFQMSADGIGTHKIARMLTAECVPSPGDYQKGVYDGTEWCASKICHLLKNKVYLGHIISNKQPKPSFKSKKRTYTDESEWIDVPGMHEPIVEKAVFDLVQRRASVKKRGIKAVYCDTNEDVNTAKPRWEKFTNVFQGLVKCVDCGSSMVISRNASSGIVYLCCTRYRRFSKDKCTPHFVQHNKLYQLVLEGIQENAAVVKANTSNKQQLEDFIQKSLAGRTNQSRKSDIANLKKLTKRKDELSHLIKRLFEENVLGNMPPERFYELSSGYEAETKEVNAKIDTLQKSLDNEVDQEASFRQFCDVMLQYVDVTALDATMLYNIIERIEIHAPEGKGKHRTQQVDIHYRFVREGVAGASNTADTHGG